MGAKDSDTPKIESAAKGISFDEKERPAAPPTAEDILREKSKSRMVRISSVIVYLIMVTGNGFLLSCFFLFVWDPQIKVSRPANMAPDYGMFGQLSTYHLKADSLVSDQDQGIMALAFKSDHPEHLPAVPHHRIMSDEFTNNYINNYHGKLVPGNGVVGGIGQAEAGVAHGLPSSAQEEYENNVSRSEHHVAEVATATGIQSKINVSNSGSSEDNSNSSSSSGGAMGKRKKPSEEISSPHQRPQV